MSAIPQSKEALDERNVVSWRVPNEPKQVDTTEEIQPKRETKEGFKSNNVNNETSGSVKSDSAPSSPVDGRKGQKSPKLLTQIPPCEEPKNNFGNKLWRMLFGNVIRSIDELYVHCEEQEDRSKCHEVVELLIRSRRDFNKLSERLQEQSKFKLGQAMSWEIRKPTLHSPMNPGLSPGHVSAVEEGKSRSFSPAQLETIDPQTTNPAHLTEPPHQKPRSKLNPGAKPFNPLGASGMQPNMDNKSPDPHQPLPPGLHTPTALISTSSTVPDGGRTSPLTLVLPTRASSAATATTTPALVSSTAHTAPPTQRSAEVHPRARAQTQSLLAKKTDDWSDERLQREVQRASEQIWAEAEAWVEAEAVAEEQEWALLALGINSYLKDSDALSDYEEDGMEFITPASAPVAAIGLRSPLLSAHNSPKQFPVGMGLGLSVPGEAGAWEGNFVALSPEQRAIWEHTPQSRYGVGKSATALGRGHRAGSRSNLSAVGALAAADVTTPSTLAVASVSPIITPVASRRRAGVGGDGRAVGTETFFGSISHSHSYGSRSPGSSYLRAHSASSRSPSPADAYLGSGASSATTTRSLHDKLSSPDRRRTISPSEAQRRYEERHINAEINRDNTIAERVQKAHIASERRARLEQKEAQRRTRVLQALESKQKEVGERRSQFLRDIQVRANNETSKVHEVNFINALNSEAIAQRLEEVETRILAASARRQERLRGITLDQKRRATRKVQQLSEWRLQFEKEKMERWDKLQQRLQIVNARRTARLTELQRRADEDNRRSLVDVATSAAGLEVPVTALSQPAATMGLPSASASNTVASARLSALKKGRSSSRSVSNPPRTAECAVAIPAVPATSAAAGKDWTHKVLSTMSTADSLPPPDLAVRSPSEKAVGEVGVAKRSKAREKKVKRRQRELLEEAAREAELAALDEAIAQNSGSSAAPPSTPVDPAVRFTESSKNKLVFPEVGSQSSPARYLAARQHVLPGLSAVSLDGFHAWLQMSQKKANVAARTDIIRCSAGDVCEALGANQESNREHVLSPSYSTPAGERAVFDKLESDDTGHLLAQLTRDLAARRSEAVSGGVLNQYAMQRLYVLLQNDPVQQRAAAGSSGNVSVSALSEMMVLRLLLGPEIGLLSRSGELQSMLEALTLLHFNRNQTGKTAESLAIASSMELEVRSEVWKLLFDLLLRCTDSQAGVSLAVQCGLGTVLADLASLLLCCMEAHRKQESSSTVSDGVYPTALTMSVGVVLAALARVLSVQPVAFPAAGGCSQATQDALLWYVFTLGLVPSLGDHLRLRTQHWQHRRSYHYLAETEEAASVSQAVGGRSSEVITTGTAEQKTELPMHAVDELAVAIDLFVGASELLCVVCSLVRDSAGLGWQSTMTTAVVVESAVQLSPATHRHCKGRQMISVLRRAELSLVFLELACMFAGCDHFNSISSSSCNGSSSGVDPSGKTAFVDSLTVLCKLVNALGALAGADLSLAQFAHSAEQQATWVSGCRLLFSILHSALDGPNQAHIAGRYEGCFINTLPCLGRAMGKAEVEEALRALLSALALSCLRSPALQKLCGAALPGAAANSATGVGLSLLNTVGGTAEGPPVRTSPHSLLHWLCTLTPKYYRDKRFRHHILACLAAMCLDCDHNVSQLARLGKRDLVLKYMQLSVRTHGAYVQREARKKTAPGHCDSDSSVAELTEETIHVLRLSRLVPSELWELACVTFSDSSK